MDVVKYAIFCHMQPGFCPLQFLSFSHCVCGCALFIQLLRHRSMYIQWNRYLFYISTQYTQRCRPHTQAHKHTKHFYFFFSAHHIANHSNISSSRYHYHHHKKRKRRERKDIPISFKKNDFIIAQLMVGWLARYFGCVCVSLNQSKLHHWSKFTHQISGRKLRMACNSNSSSQTHSHHSHWKIETEWKRQKSNFLGDFLLLLLLLSLFFVSPLFIFHLVLPFFPSSHFVHPLYSLLHWDPSCPSPLRRSLVLEL